MPDALIVPRYSAVDLCRRGTELLHSGAPDQAEKCFLAALARDPNSAIAYQHLAVIHVERRLFDAAIAYARRVVNIEPSSGVHWGNLASTLHRAQRFDEAREAFHQAFAIDPDRPILQRNFGLYHYALGDDEKAVFHHDRALALGGPSDSIESDRAYALLGKGDLAAGFQALEWRWKFLAKLPPWECGAPLWDGSSAEGKTLLIHHEQGFGDTLQFSRFLFHVKQTGARVVLALPPELRRLFAAQSHLADRIVDIGAADPGEPVDYHLPLMSLPRVLGIEHPDEIENGPYLKLPEGRTVDIAKDPRRLDVGIVWSCRPTGRPQYFNRVMDLGDFLGFAGLPGVTLFSLQKGWGEDDITVSGAEGLVVNMAPAIEDFADTAGIIDQLDLVVTIDSAIAHLAGAFGKPVIMITPFTRCWRWRWGDQVWYRSMRIVQQRAPGDWRSVMKRIADMVIEARKRKACPA